MKIPLILTCLATVTFASSATVIGVKFAANSNGNADSAALQAGGNSFGATWTDIINDSVTAQPLNGTTATLNLAASGWWGGGSWTGANGTNSEISVFRTYLNDNGITINLNGLSAWLATEGKTGYTVTLFASSDNGTSFRDATVGGTTVSIPVGGNGSWNGTSEDPLGNSTQGIRGIGVSGILTEDNLTISLPSHNYPERSSLAGFMVTAVPEPGSAALAIVGLGSLLTRRRR
ncbi:MAG: PEP-CTERM sorting domain-containing protein [Verrucomicrobiaceae bacterium]|nr:MAG: PEP-CTERM sorting domain-containing protein [Verrucomicrobiaceae bacterium]